jgi:hypothetical protein
MSPSHPIVSRRLLVLFALTLFVMPTREVTGEENSNPKVISGTLTIPARIGITKNGHNREKPGSATITPAAEAANVTVSPSSTKVTLSGFQTNTSTGVITFTITGVSASGDPGDVPVVARHATAGELDRETCSVIIPKSIKEPQPPFEGPVVPTRYLLNAGTSPVVWDLPAPRAVGVIVALHTLELTVIDQFTQLCGDVYAGADITENNNQKINQVLKASSTYSDPVFIFRTGPIFANIAGADAQAWVAGGTAADNPPPTRLVQNIPVQVDTFPMTNGIRNRIVTYNDATRVLKISY